MAPAGVNVRTGPGTAYPILGVAPQGTEGTLIGVSEDGAWWVAEVPTAPSGMGWVAAAYILATGGAGNLPVVATPPLPTPAAAASAPAAAPTPVPVPDELAAGSQILFSASRIVRTGGRVDYHEDIYSVPAAPGSSVTLIVENAMQPDYQASSNILAFRSMQSDQLGLGGWDFNSDKRIRLSRNVEDSRPSWSNTGGRLAFSSKRQGDRRWRVYTTPAVPSDDRTGFAEPTNLDFGKDADWSPNKEVIVFKGCDPTGNNCGIWTMNSDDSLPRWSPDSNRVVFMSDSRDGNWELYSIPAAGGTVTRLTNNPANDGLPAWSPNGSQIAFMSNRDGAWGIWVTPAAGGNAQLITHLNGDVPDWLLQGIDWPR
jgi:hypothetical protein